MDNGTYLLIVVIGFILTLVVGVILMKAGYGFLRDVFDDDSTATSTTWLLGVLFYLVALGLLGLASPHKLVPSLNNDTEVIQIVVTQLGGVLLVLGVLHGLTLLLLSQMRNRRRSQAIEESMTDRFDQNRRPRQPSRQQVIEAGGSQTGTAPSQQ